MSTRFDDSGPSRISLSANSYSLSPIKALISQIRMISSGHEVVEFDPKSIFNVDVRTEQILINRKTVKVRKVYLVAFPEYKVGWVVDSDLKRCMICGLRFGWTRYRHHCRACGSLVCNACSPYKTTISRLDEEGGSRVCKNCFGLRTDVLANNPLPAVEENTPTRLLKKQSIAAGSNVIFSPHENRELTYRIRRKGKWKEGSESFDSSNPKESATEELERLEREQAPKYEMCYLRMRELVPPYIAKTTMSKMIEEGLPENFANRLWETKVLWLLVMHVDDIVKIHIADLRGKYQYQSLDIVEMRAVWHCLSQVTEWMKMENAMPKLEWKLAFKSKLDDMAYKEAYDKLPEHQKRNPVYAELEGIAYFDPFEVIDPRYIRSASMLREAIMTPDNAASSKEGRDQEHFRHDEPSKANDVDTRRKVDVKDRIRDYDTGQGGRENYRSNYVNPNAAPMTSERIAFNEEEDAPSPYATYQTDSVSPRSHALSDSTAEFLNTALMTPDNVPVKDANISTVLDDDISELSMDPIDGYEQQLPSERRTYQRRLPPSSVGNIPQSASGRARLPFTPASMVRPSRKLAPTPGTQTSVGSDWNWDKNTPASQNTPMVATSSSTQQDRAISMEEALMAAASSGNPGERLRGLAPDDPENSMGISDSDSQDSRTINSEDFAAVSGGRGSQNGAKIFPRRAGGVGVAGGRRGTANGKPDAKTALSSTRAPSDELSLSSIGRVANNDISRANPLTPLKPSLGVDISKPARVLGPSSNSLRSRAKNRVPFGGDDGQAQATPIGRESSGSFSSQNSGRQSLGQASTASNQSYTPARMAAIFLAYLTAGEASKAKQFMETAASSDGQPFPRISPAEATTLLFKCVDDLSALLEPMETITMLVETLGADVNATDALGRSPLQVQAMNQELGVYFIAKGADALQCDANGVCALGIAMEHGHEWMLEAFEQRGHEAALIADFDAAEMAYGSDPSDSNNLKLIQLRNRVRRFVECLIMGGYGSEAAGYIDSGRVHFTKEQASELLKTCQGNFDHMKEPVETVELLERFGAELHS